MTQVSVKVLRTVSVSDDGLRTREILKGTEDAVPASTLAGLVKEGYVEVIDAPSAPPAPPSPSVHPPVEAPKGASFDVDTLSAMKVADLRALAEERGVDLADARSKPDLIAAIAAALAPKA